MSHALPLATLRKTVLKWPSGGKITAPLDLTLHSVKAGGFALFGRNGCGKTLLSNALAADSNDTSWLHAGGIERSVGWTSRQTSTVSFASHEALLLQGGSVYRCLVGPPGAPASKAAQYLVVRFGLHPLLHRPVTALSTGEIRKVLLARALSTRPSLLVLDNAFDGLDVPSRRSLATLISTTLKGFGQLLVQGLDATATAHTQACTFHRSGLAWSGLVQGMLSCGKSCTSPST